MRKLILFLATSTFLMTVPVVSSEREFELSNENHYQLTSTVYDGYYQSIPSNPNVLIKTTRYKDTNLSDPAGALLPDQKFTIVNLIVNDNLQPIFELSDKTYILASHETVFDDVILEHSYQENTFWVVKGFTVLTSPIANQAKKVSKTPNAYSKVKTTELVTTPKGQFAKVPEGWISLDFLSSKDNRMTYVQEILEQKYNYSDFGIYVQQIDTGLTAGVNQDKMMYSASVAKLPILYYSQISLEDGKYSLNHSFKYTPSVHGFSGAYRPEGSGILPKEANNKTYTLSELISLTAKKSDNVASNMLGYYVANQFDRHFYETIDGVTSQRWNMEDKNASPKMAGLIMAALYHLNPSGFVLEELSQTDFDNQRISKTIDVKVAHKIGDAYDFRHDVAIVYADSPFVISIFTNNRSYDDISNIAADIYKVLK